ncbi:prolyl endopeptidase-like [Dysidea avara]|uniref:prolyl endopeptidase-like n=1 Tax=Dysidea avara TaxID=196820 RepID=UPI00332BABC2
MWRYPKPRKQDDVSEAHSGTTVEDPYRWMEEPDSDETKQFVTEQNAISQPFLSGNPVREKFHKRMMEVYNYPKYGAPFKRGNRYYYYYNTGLQNQSVLYTQKSLSDDATIFLDPNTFSEDGTVSLGTSAFSEDGELFAYAISQSGSDWQTIKVRDVKTGEDLNDELKMVKFSGIAWTHDGKGFFYQRYPDEASGCDGSETTKLENHMMCYHYLHTAQSTDLICCKFPEHPDWLLSGDVTDDGCYLIVKVYRGAEPKNHLYYYNLSSGGVKSSIPLTTIVDEFEASYDVMSNDGPIFTILTNFQASRYCLKTVDLLQPSKVNWKTLVAERDKDVLEEAIAVNNNQLILIYLRDVKNVMELHQLETGQLLDTFPIGTGTIAQLSGKRRQSEVFYLFQSFLTAGEVYHCDLTASPLSSTLFRSIEVKGFISSDYTTEQVFYTTNDGASIPMFIVHRKGISFDGTNPCLLYGYGGFNISIMPRFSTSRLLFMQHFNGIFALANIRGGGEYGEAWHQAGMFEKKQNVFDDFHCAAEYLIAKQYTSDNRLAIQGGSNGGLLVCTCANQRPELYQCVISQVGVLDMLRFHKFTIGSAWTTEFGNPDKEEDFKYIYKYSPLHNIPTSGRYPAILLLTGDHDDRVVPLHSLKFIATIQDQLGQQATNPLMIRVDVKSGHGAGKPTSKLIDEMADIYSFIASTLNITWQD